MVAATAPGGHRSSMYLARTLATTSGTKQQPQIIERLSSLLVAVHLDILNVKL